MKKKYFAPEMEVVKINAQQQLLTESITVTLDDATEMSNGELGSRELDLFD